MLSLCWRNKFQNHSLQEMKKVYIIIYSPGQNFNCHLFYVSNKETIIIDYSLTFTQLIRVFINAKYYLLSAPFADWFVIYAVKGDGFTKLLCVAVIFPLWQAALSVTKMSQKSFILHISERDNELKIFLLFFFQLALTKVFFVKAALTVHREEIIVPNFMTKQPVHSLLHRSKQKNEPVILSWQTLWAVN